MSLRALDELCGYVARLVTLGMLFQKIWEEEHLQDGKHDKQFYQDNRGRKPYAENCLCS